MWLTSSKVLPVIVLIVIPFLATILAPVVSHFVPYIKYRVAGFTYIFSYVYLISAIGVVYSIYPVKFHNIERRGFLNLMIEHAYVRKILYFEVPILIATTSVFVLIAFSDPLNDLIFNFFSATGQPLRGLIAIYVTSPSDPTTPYNYSKYGAVIMGIVVNGLMINLVFSVTAGIIWMILVAVRKELGYHFAKLLFQTTTHEKEESKKAEYLIKATKLYDKYLRRTLNLEINDAKRIYSKILSDSNLNENESMRLISESFDSNNKLEPIKTLSKMAYVEDDKDTFLVDESIGKRIKDVAIFFATIIPIAVTIIQLLLQRE